MAIFLAIIQRDNKKGEKMRITETLALTWWVE